jgi:hypothetical protein
LIATIRHSSWRPAADGVSDFPITRSPLRSIPLTYCSVRFSATNPFSIDRRCFFDSSKRIAADGKKFDFKRLIDYGRAQRREVSQKLLWDFSYLRDPLRSLFVLTPCDRGIGRCGCFLPLHAAADRARRRSLCRGTETFATADPARE